MGHIHLGVLPNTVKWNTVVALLGEGGADEDVIAASAVAAERDLANAPDDPTFVECLRLLAMIPQAARQDDFGARLRDLGLAVHSDPSLPDLVSAVGNRLDRSRASQFGTTDFAELSRRALLGTLSSTIGADLPGLFSATPDDVRAATARFATPARFSPLARAFFTRLLSETLSAYLDRTLSAHVGAGLRFPDLQARSAFDAQLGKYCMESTRIIREFAAGWYGKTMHREGEVRTRHAAAFGAVAFRKIGEELRRKRGRHG